MPAESSELNTNPKPGGRISVLLSRDVGRGANAVGYCGGRGREGEPRSEDRTWGRPVTDFCLSRGRRLGLC